MHPAKTKAIESAKEQIYLRANEIPTSDLPWTPCRLWSRMAFLIQTYYS